MQIELNDDTIGKNENSPDDVEQHALNKSTTSITDAAQAFAAYIEKQKSYRNSPKRQLDQELKKRLSKRVSIRDVQELEQPLGRSSTAVFNEGKPVIPSPQPFRISLMSTN